MEEDVWKKEVRENTSAKDLGPCHRIKRGVYTEKGKGALIVEGRKGGSTDICGGSVEKRIHLTFQVTPNITSTLHSKKGWHTENGIELLTHKLVNNKEWVFFTLHCRHTGWSRKEEGVHKAGPEVGI